MDESKFLTFKCCLPSFLTPTSNDQPRWLHLRENLSGFKANARVSPDDKYCPAAEVHMKRRREASPLISEEGPEAGFRHVKVCVGEV